LGGDSTTADSGDSSAKTDGADSGDSATVPETSTSPETGSPDGSDGATNDGATKADAADAAVCGAENAACAHNGNDALCKGGACAACADPTDDVHCTAAYGSATMPYLCLAGVCTPGNCRHNGDCTGNANGGLCGPTTPNVCGKCTADPQCADQAGGPVCDIGTGACVAGTCPVDAGVSSGAGVGVCPVNAGDICCTGTCQPGTGANACCPGANSAAFCAMKLNNPHATCDHNTCTACGAVTGNSYTVDPVNGSDQTGTGDTTPGCGFKTIARALQVIGTPASTTSIVVVGPSTVAAGETFPIVLPANVNLTTSGGAVTVDVPDGTSGFTLNAPGSGINLGSPDDAGAGNALVINGRSTGNMATFGIVVDTGAGVTAANAPQISFVDVTSFVNDGIFVHNAGIVRIGAAVTSRLNGLTSARRAGLHVTGTGQAIIDVPAGETPSHFDANTNHGILVDENGSVTITGTVIDGATGTGTVTTNANYLAGIWIEQTPGTPPLNSISGVVSFGNTNGNGMRFVGGSNVKLRNSVLLGNQVNGLIVSAGAGAPGNDITTIDVGTTGGAGTTFGGNTLQGALGFGNNSGAGLCLDMGDNAGTLKAAGNVFEANNCATGAHALHFNAGGCDNLACAGGVCDLGITDGTGNDIDVTMCTH
jgi:hypothetical protein